MVNKMSLRHNNRPGRNSIIRCASRDPKAGPRVEALKAAAQEVPETEARRDPDLAAEPLDPKVFNEL